MDIKISFVMVGLCVCVGGGGGGGGAQFHSWVPVTKLHYKPQLCKHVLVRSANIFARKNNETTGLKIGMNTQFDCGSKWVSSHLVIPFSLYI